MIPYAASRIENGQLVRICPECGEEFTERTDQFGEQTTNHYAIHYDKEHCPQISTP